MIAHLNSSDSSGSQPKKRIISFFLKAGLPEEDRDDEGLENFLKQLVKRVAEKGVGTLVTLVRACYVR